MDLEIMSVSIKKGKNPNNENRYQILLYCHESSKNHIVNMHPKKWRKHWKKVSSGNSRDTPTSIDRNSVRMKATCTKMADLSWVSAEMYSSPPGQ